MGKARKHLLMRLGQGLIQETPALCRKIAFKTTSGGSLDQGARCTGPGPHTLRGHLDYISSHLALLTETRDHMEAARVFLEKESRIFRENDDDRSKGHCFLPITASTNACMTTVAFPSRNISVIVWVYRDGVTLISTIFLLFLLAS